MDVKQTSFPNDRLIRLPSPIGGRQLRYFIRLAANGLQQGLSTIGTTLLIRLAFDRMAKGPGQMSLRLMTLIGSGLLVAALWKAWLKKAERVDAERMGQTYIHQIRKICFEHLSTLAPRAMQKRSKGSVMLRFVGDLNAIRRWISMGLARITVSSVMMTGALIALSILNGILGLAVTLVIALSMATLLLLGKPVGLAVRKARGRRSRMASNIYEKISAMTVVQVFGQSDHEKKRLSRQSRRLKDAVVGEAKAMGRLRAHAELTAGVAGGAVLLLGAYEIASLRASVGTVAAAMTLIYLIIPALRDLERVYEYWQRARISREKIETFLKTPSLVAEIPGAPDLQAEEGRLRFENVTIPGSLKRVTAVAEGGAVVAIVGPNGAGKSTLLALAARLIDPVEGRVTLDEQDLARHSLASVRRAIGMMSPDLPLLKGTVERNLRYRWPDAPEEEVDRVKRLCGLDELLAEFPDGDKTKVTEGGGNLSPGQRQRITLARALLGNPLVLLLDEPDSNLDPKGSAILDKLITEYSGTILLVTQRAERLKAAHIVWRMEEGRLVETVSQEEMLRNRSFLPTETPEKPDSSQDLHHGTVSLRTLRGEPGQKYFLYIPPKAGKGSPLFVSVHGISRNAKEQARWFSPFCDTYGVILLSPLFPKNRFPDYQRLGRHGGRADLTLNRILGEVGDLTEAVTNEVFLFGYSGGGQFVHRYAMAYPERVKRVVVVAAGWYTFPVPGVNYPKGIKESLALSDLRFDPSRFLKVPFCVMVGDMDIERDMGLRKSPTIDTMEGETRLERGKRWILSMEEMARKHRLETSYVFETLENCNHSFEACMTHSDMGRKVFHFLFGPPPVP